MAKKKGLGKGLGALIADNNTQDNSNALTKEIELSKIETNPFQPRKNFDEEALQELSDSIKLLGIIQPITLRKIDGKDKYQLISGERRYRATKLANLKTIASYVRTANDQGMMEMALVENIQREDLDAIEVALSFDQLLTEYKLTQETLSERVGKKRSTVANYLRLLNLPPEIQLGIKTRSITMGHAKAIINISDSETQLMIFEQILKYNFSVRKTEEVVKELNEGGGTKTTTNKRKKAPAEYKVLEKHLSNHFDSKVDFKINNNGKGKIVIDFKSTEDLERIIEIIDKL